MGKRISLISFTYAGGLGVRVHAAVGLSIDGKVEDRGDFGVGPVDAAFIAMNALLRRNAVIEKYDVHAPNPGSGGVARVEVTISEDGRTAEGVGRDHDTMVASAHALVNAFNALE